MMLGKSPASGDVVGSVLLVLLSPVVGGAFLQDLVEGGERKAGAGLTLLTDGPVVLDAPLTVNATLFDVDVADGPFYFSFADDASPMHYEEVQTSGLEANFTLSYSSGSYEEQTFTMTVRVYKMYTIFRTEIAKGTVSYGVTRSLNGLLLAVQPNETVVEIKGIATLAVNETTRFVVELHDPSGFFAKADMVYYWFVNQTNYGTTNGTAFAYDFQKVGDSSVEVLVVASLSDPLSDDAHRRIGGSKTSVDAVATAASVDSNVKSGLFKLKVHPTVPMRSVTVSGEKWLKHGELLNLTVTCDGSGPWTYCWAIKDSSFNMTGNETCDGSYEVAPRDCSFQIVWYLRYAGESAVLVVVDNVLDHVVKQVGINVYDVPSRTPVSLIVIPLCSALVAVVASISGVFVFMTFKRNMAGLETADFDFNCPDEQLEYKTFWERLRDSMLNALSNSSNDEGSQVSSAVSSRSIQGPPVGIHYGSIT